MWKGRDWGRSENNSIFIKKIIGGKALLELFFSLSLDQSHLNAKVYSAGLNRYAATSRLEAIFRVPLTLIVLNREASPNVPMRNLAGRESHSWWWVTKMERLEENLYIRFLFLGTLENSLCQRDFSARRRRGRNLPLCHEKG